MMFKNCFLFQDSPYCIWPARLPSTWASCPWNCEWHCCPHWTTCLLHQCAPCCCCNPQHASAIPQCCPSTLWKATHRFPRWQSQCFHHCYSYSCPQFLMWWAVRAQFQQQLLLLSLQLLCLWLQLTIVHCSWHCDHIETVLTPCRLRISSFRCCKGKTQWQGKGRHLKKCICKCEQRFDFAGSELKLTRKRER